MKNCSLICILIFISCNTEQLHYINEQDFKQEIILKSQRVHVNELLNVDDFFLKDNILIVKNDRQDSIFMIYSYPEWECIGAFGTYGRGPEEYLIPKLINDFSDNSFSVIDLSNNSLTEFNLATLNSKRRKLRLNEYLPQTILYSSEAAAFLYDSNQNEVLLHRITDDYNTSIIYNFDDLRKRFYDHNAYWGFLGADESFNRIIYAYQYLRRFDILDYNGNLVKTVVVEPYHDPVIKGDKINYVNSVNSYFGIRTSRDSFFLYFIGHKGEDLMNNLNLKTFIEEFDWNGKPLRRFEINKFLWSFDLLKNGNEVVGFIGLDKSSENPFVVFLFES